jgi:hypothetical protein
VDNCEKVLCELFVTAPLAPVSLIKKDEARTRSFDDPFNNLHSEPCESVPVGHHNLFDHSLLAMFQKPLESFPFVVEAGGHVFVDTEARVRFLHGFDLALKVVFLLGRGHPTVDCPFDSLGRFFVGGCFVVFEVLSVIGWSRGVSKRASVEPPMSTWCELEANELVVCPCPECVAADSKDLRCDTGTNKFSRFSMPIGIVDHLEIKNIQYNMYVYMEKDLCE